MTTTSSSVLLRKKLAVQVFASAVLARHAFVPHGVHAGIDRQRIVRNELRTLREAARQLQRGEDAIRFVAMHTRNQTDRRLHRVRRKRRTTDNFQKFEFPVFEVQVADSLNVKHIVPQGEDGGGKRAVISLPRRTQTAEFRLKRWREVPQGAVETTVRKHLEYAPRFVTLPFPHHQFHLAHDDGELFWRQPGHTRIVAR